MAYKFARVAAPLLAAVLTQAQMPILGAPGGGRGSAIDGTAPGFWDTHALVLVHVMARPAPNRVTFSTLRVLTSRFPIPVELNVEIALRPFNIPNDPKPGDLFLLLLEKDPRSQTGWGIPGSAIAFMPATTPLALLTDEKDIKIEQLQKSVHELQSIRQLAQLADAKQAISQHLDQQIADYNAYWKNHALILAKTAENPGGPVYSMKIETVATLFTQIAVPQSLALPAGVPTYIIQHLNGGMAVLVVEKKDDGTWINRGYIPCYAFTDNINFWQVRDEKDPKIEQIEKAVQSWQQQILDGKFPDNDKDKPPAPSPYLAPTTAPSTTSTPATKP